MWELDHKEGWVPKKQCFLTVVLEKMLQSPLDCKEIRPVNSKGNQTWIFMGRTDAEAEALILWPPDANIWLIGKDPDAGKKLRAWGEGGNRGWDGGMATSTQWTWICTNSRRWWRTGKPGMPLSMGLQIVGHDWVNNNNEQRPWRQFKFCTTLGLLWLWGKVYKNNYNTIRLSCQAVKELFERRGGTILLHLLQPVPSGAGHIADVPLMSAELSSPRAENSDSSHCWLSGFEWYLQQNREIK